MDIKTTRRKEKIPHPHKTQHKAWIGTYIILSLGCLALWLLFRENFFHLSDKYRDIAIKLSFAGFWGFIILIIGKIVQGVIIKQTHIRAVQYNLVRLIRLLTTIIIAFIVISFLNENWYTAAVSLGLISLILGFALQSPIASIIGWLYIVVRAPYKVGDRIQIASFTGDVIEIGYFDTTLWEFAGNYMTNDLPSGRLIRFPNSLVWQNEVYNYSWKKFPYIWNEIPFHVAYQSDLDFVERAIRKVAKAELGEGMEENVERLRDMIKETPVDELEIKEYPFVNFRIDPNTWVEVLLIYLVEPRQASAVRTNLIKKVLAALLKEPGKVMFPKGDSR